MSHSSSSLITPSRTSTAQAALDAVLPARRSTPMRSSTSIDRATEPCRPCDGTTLMDQQRASTAMRGSFCGRTRREFLWEIGGGFGSVALTGLLGGGRVPGAAGRRGRRQRRRFVNPLAPKAPPLPAKAKSVIFLFMYGGPSHVDTFDYKPKLYPLDGKTIAVKTFGRGGKKNEGRIVGPKWSFRQYGQCGKWVSDLVPAPGDLRRRHRVHPLDVRRVADPRLGHADDELGPAPVGQPVPGHVGHLRPGQRERKPARLRGDARPDRRPDQRRQELVERLHAGGLPGDGAPVRRRADPRPGLARGHRPRDPPAACSTGSARRTRTTWPPGRQLRAGRADRQLRAGVQDAAVGARGRRLRPRIARDPGALRHRPAAHGRLRPQVPDRPAAGRARRALRPDLLRRRPQRRQLGRPRRPGRQPHQARRRHRQADRRLAQGPEAPRAARSRP